MFAVGLDVDKFVFTIKILLYAGNSNISSPLVFIALGKIYYPLSLYTVGPGLRSLLSTNPSLFNAKGGRERKSSLFCLDNQQETLVLVQS